VADIKNIGLPMVAGTIIAGLFLKEFVDPKIAWAHLDIASTGWSDESRPLGPAGSTGFVVRTLLNYILSYN
jgi:leucyl aminopeptidase